MSHDINILINGKKLSAVKSQSKVQVLHEGVLCKSTEYRSFTKNMLNIMYASVHDDGVLKQLNGIEVATTSTPFKIFHFDSTENSPYFGVVCGISNTPVTQQDYMITPFPSGSELTYGAVSIGNPVIDTVNKVILLSMDRDVYNYNSTSVTFNEVGLITGSEYGSQENVLISRDVVSYTIDSNKKRTISIKFSISFDDIKGGFVSDFYTRIPQAYDVKDNALSNSGVGASRIFDDGVVRFQYSNSSSYVKKVYSRGIGSFGTMPSFPTTGANGGFFSKKYSGNRIYRVGSGYSTNAYSPNSLAYIYKAFITADDGATWSYSGAAYGNYLFARGSSPVYGVATCMDDDGRFYGIGGSTTNKYTGTILNESSCSEPFSAPPKHAVTTGLFSRVCSNAFALSDGTVFVYGGYGSDNSYITGSKAVQMTTDKGVSFTDVVTTGFVPGTYLTIQRHTDNYIYLVSVNSKYYLRTIDGVNYMRVDISDTSTVATAACEVDGNIIIYKKQSSSVCRTNTTTRQHDYCAGIGDSSYGLQVGTGTTAFSPSDTSLAVLNTTLDYDDVICSKPTVAGNVNVVSYMRSFTNSTSSDITVTEIGLRTERGIQHVRVLLGTPVTIVAGASESFEIAFETVV